MQVDDFKKEIVDSILGFQGMLETSDGATKLYYRGEIAKAKYMLAAIDFAEQSVVSSRYDVRLEARTRYLEACDKLEEDAK